MKKEIEIKKKKPKLAYDGMDRKTLVEAVPTQVVEVVYPSKAEKKEEDTLFAKGELQQKITKSEDLPKNRLIWTNDNLVALKTLLDEKDPVSGDNFRCLVFVAGACESAGSKRTQVDG